MPGALFARLQVVEEETGLSLGHGGPVGDGPGRETSAQRFCGKPRSTVLVAGSGQRSVMTLARV